jgi:hypothetical protein
MDCDLPNYDPLTANTVYTLAMLASLARNFNRHARHRSRQLSPDVYNFSADPQACRACTSGNRLARVVSRPPRSRISLERYPSNFAFLESRCYRISVPPKFSHKLHIHKIQNSRHTRRLSMRSIPTGGESNTTCYRTQRVGSYRGGFVKVEHQPADHGHGKPARILRYSIRENMIHTTP